MATKRFCDICEKEVAFSEIHNLIVYSDGLTKLHKPDVCPKCFKQIADFIKSITKFKGMSV